MAVGLLLRKELAFLQELANTCLCLLSAPPTLLFRGISSSLMVLVSRMLFCKSREPQHSITNPFSLSDFNGEEGITEGCCQHLGPHSC